jgi:hypothetical protein
MTFEATEISAFSEPVEFLTLQDGGESWYYTNSNSTQVIGARTFEPLPYTRTEPVYSKDSSNGQVKLKVPSNIPLVRFYEQIPSSSTATVQIERQHRNDPDGGVQIFWKGQVASVQREGKFTTILAVPYTQLPAQVPRYSYSGLCNWFLFQDECGLTRESWRHNDVVSSIVTGTLITVTDLRTQAAALALNGGGTLTAQEIDDYWLGGYIETLNGEKRAIYETDVGGVPDTVRVLQPFRELQVNDEVFVYAGCPRTRDFCFRKFNNALNHGGFPDIPTINPFTTELPSGDAAPDKKRWFGN